MTQCQIPRSTSVTDVLVDCDTHVLTIIQTSPSGKESHQSVDLSCIIPATSKVTDVFYDCDAEQLVITQITDGVCAGGDCTETFVVSLACILEHAMPACGDMNSITPLPVGAEVVICTPDGPKTTPPSALLPAFDCGDLPTACCPRPPAAMFMACNEGDMVLVPPIDLITCEDLEFANPVPDDLNVVVCGGSGSINLLKVPVTSLLACGQIPYLEIPEPDTLLLACTPEGLVKIDRAEDGGGGIGEAPIDGTPYERQDAGWVPAGAAGVSTDAGNVTVIGSDGKIYTDALLQTEVLGGEHISVNQNADGSVTVNAAFPVSLKAHWHYDDVIGSAAPEVGYMHVDTATLDLATLLFLNKTDWEGNTIGDGIKLIQAGDFLIMQDIDRDALVVYAATGVPIDQGTYYEVPVSYVNGNSTDPAQDDLIDFIWFPASLSQDLVGEAPIDGTPYERQDGTWVPAGDFRVIVQEFAPDVATSDEGDEWFRASNGDQFTLYVNPVDGRRQWVSPGGGSQGQDGPQGETGPQGPEGPTGPISPNAVGDNVLINGDFRVNQRGFDGDWGPMATGAYGYDRWKKVITQTQISQTIEEANYIPSTDYVLSDDMEAPRIITSPASGDWLILILIGATWAKLEVGSVPTPFQVTDIGVELAKCQRYLLKLANVAASPAPYAHLPMVMASNSSTAILSGVGSTMQGTATLIWNGPIILNDFVNIGSIPVTAVSLDQGDANNFTLNFSVTEPLTPGQMYGVTCQNNSKIFIESEI